MGKVLAITNQKGGVGKTTTSVNLSASLAATKRKALLIDLDPQGNATMGSGIDKKDLSVSIYDVLMGEKSIEEATLSLENTQYDLLPSNSDLTGAEVGLLNITNREIQLRKEVEKIRDKYAYIIIDCPPSLNMLTVNAGSS